MRWSCAYCYKHHSTIVWVAAMATPEHAATQGHVMHASYEYFEPQILVRLKYAVNYCDSMDTSISKEQS